MVIDERETANGNDCDLNSGMGVMNEATDDKGGLFDSSSGGGGGNFGEGTSSDGLRIYTRKKRRKMSYSDEMVKSKFNDKIKTADRSASDQDARVSFDAYPFGPGECSLRNCRKIVLKQMYQSLSGSEDGLRECIRNALVTHPETGCTSAIKESFDCFERCMNQAQNSAKEPSHNVTSSGSLNESESSTITELCRRAFFEILMSEKFSELCGLLLKNFGDVNIDRILDINAINSRMKNGAYETSPLLYLKDIQQVWTKLQQVGNEMVTLAKSLSDKSRTHYEQFVRKACGASNCQGCGERADVQNCLICDSCEEIYHLSCTNLNNQEIPPKNWYCTTCFSNGMGSPHDHCIVCEKLKIASSKSLLDGVFENTSNGSDPDDAYNENQDSITCFICKSQVKKGDIFRTCGHSLCAHKFYHYTCLTTKQLGVCGPCWYCPSCLCRACLVDKDDDQIVLCDGCDQAYHIYCTSPTLDSIPTGSWFCAKCDRELKRIRTVKRVYDNMQKRVKIEENEGENEGEKRDKSGGLDMLVTAAKTLSHQETMKYGYP